MLDDATTITHSEYIAAGAAPDTIEISYAADRQREPSETAVIVRDVIRTHSPDISGGAAPDAAKTSISDIIRIWPDGHGAPTVAVKVQYDAKGMAYVTHI